MRLYLVRHGETEANRLRLALGRDDVPLNATGLGQATRVAAALAGEPIVAVYSSPLARALVTAAPIAASHGLVVETDPRLIEMDIGELDGLTFDAVRERYPRLLEAWTTAEGPDHHMPGRERLADVRERARAAISAIERRHREASAAVCVVTHNFVILSLLVDVLGIDLAAFRRLRHAVAAISLLEVSSDRRRIVRLNDTCHLLG